MVKKKETPVALFSVKGDFVRALDNVAHEGIMLLTALETALNHNTIPKNIAGLLKERAEAFRAALTEPLKLHD